MSRTHKYRFWNTKHNRFEKGSGYIFSTNGFNGVEYVIPQQFTGLLDKNGAEIYEGDILAYTDKDGKYNSAYQCKWGDRSCDHCAVIIGYDTECEEMSIIGNIYETPHLLEANQ